MLLARPSSTQNDLAAATARLLKALEELSTNPSVALRLLKIVDDPKSSARDLANVISADPALTARVLKMANSSYYGLSHQIRSPAQAISFLGFTTIRAIAVTGAAGLFSKKDTVPPEFWHHASLTAAASAMISRRVGVERSDAFSLGILHDIGRALLHRVSPPLTKTINERVAMGESLIDLERELFGIDHAAAAAQVLGAWKFPDSLVTTIGHHHDDIVTGSYGLLLAAAEAVAYLAMSDGEELSEVYDVALSHVGLTRDDGIAMGVIARREADALAPALAA